MIGTFARTVARSLARLRRRSIGPVERPDYADRALFAILAQAPTSNHSAGLEAALAMHAQSADSAAIESVADHFGCLARPRFFADPRTLCTAPDDPYATRAMRASAGFAQEVTTRGLTIYGRASPPLRRGFPWDDATGSGARDILFTAFPHRFTFLPPLALACATGELACTALMDILDDWMGFAARDPRLPFCSNLVITQRLFACLWSLAFATIRDDEAGIRWRILKIVAQDVCLLLPRLGDSYPNNHLLVDRFTAWLIALLLPEMIGGALDVAAAESAWIAELERQTYDDGGSFEHAAHYHRFVAEAGAAYLLLSDANARRVPECVRARIGRMLGLQSKLCGVEGRAPAFGDSSDDPLFAIDGHADGNAAALRELDRALFNPGLEPVSLEHSGRVRAWWMLGGRLADAKAAAASALVSTFDSAGIVVFDDDLARTRMAFRLGPMAGTEYAPGHQHADVLSITLSSDGVPLLVDGGTFTYRFGTLDSDASGTNWRAYFAGSAAHNGLVIDGASSFPPLQGDFRNSGRLPEVRTTCAATGGHLAVHEARFEGCAPFPAWTRGVVCLRGALILVYDVLDDVPAERAARLALQWAPECELSLISTTGALAKVRETGVRVAWSDGLGASAIRCGSERPPAGWVSLRYGERVAAPQMFLPVIRTGISALAFAPLTASPLSVIEASAPRSGLRVFRVESDAGTDLVWLNAGAPGSPIDGGGIRFDGRLAWIRMPRAGQPVVRWLDGRSLSAGNATIERLLPRIVAEYGD